MQKRSCCRHSTDWRKRRPETESRSAKPDREGLIQEGAILEKVLPGSANDRAVCTGGLSDTEAAAARLNPLEISGKPGAFLFFLPKGALTHHLAKAGGGSPPVGRALCALHEAAFSRFSREGRAMPQADIACAVGCHISPEHQTVVTTSQLPAKNCHRQLCRRYGYRFSGDTHFLFAKKKQKRRKVRTNGNLPFGSKSGQPGQWAFCCLPLPPI